MGYCATDVAAESIVSRSRAGRARPFGRFAEDSTLPMTLLLAAVGAVVTALLELTVGPYLRIGDATPNLVLVFGVVVTIAVGLEAGLVWAFVGGLALDVIAQRPLGSSSFALLLCVGGASVLARSFARLRPITPIGAVFVLSIGYSMILFLAFGALGAPLPVSDPLATVLPSAIYDAVLAAIVGPLVIAVHDRRMDQERVDW
jgi:rod shape-determining protein MreD